MKKSSFHLPGTVPAGISVSSIADERCKAKEKSIRFFFAFFVVLALMAAMIGGCTPAGVTLAKDESASKQSLTDTAMGTIISMTVYPGGGMTGEEARELLAETKGLVRSLEETVLSRKLETAELWKIDQKAGDKEGMPISELLSGILEECFQVSEDSGGAFDVSVGPLVRLWRMDERAAGEEEATLPTAEEIERAAALCGWDKIRLADGKITLAEGACIDLGAVGKGIALDEIVRALEGTGVSGVFSLGGSILTYGEKPDGSPWRVGVVDPRDPAKTLGNLELRGQWCVSTSGDYERFFEVDCVRYHHLLDPATGYPARSGLRSVTILSRSGFLSDALSTACFVLGREKGMELAEKYQAEILLVEEDGTIYMSEGLKSIFSAIN